jgi:hypothetical protein
MKETWKEGLGSHAPLGHISELDRLRSLREIIPETKIGLKSICK